MDNSDFMKIQKNFSSIESINRVKWQSMEWEKIFVNHIYAKGNNIQSIWRISKTKPQKTKHQ